MGGCAIPGCTAEPERGSTLQLCRTHLLTARDWVDREFGVTDVLPSPCQACGSRLGVRYPSGWLCAVCEWRHGEQPDADLPRMRVDVVYYLRYDDRIKIGTTANPRQRLAALPYQQLLAFERGGRAVEQRRHAQFATLRYPGSEWFRVDDALLAHAAELSAGVEDPWSLHARWVSEALAR